MTAAVPTTAAEVHTPPAEITLRAVASGLVIGGFLALANLYMGLKLGFTDSGNVTAALLGFALCRAFGRTAGRLYSPLENQITQTLAVMMGVVPASAGLLSALPALRALGHTIPGGALVVWAAVLGTLGVLWAAVLRGPLLERERLPFPTGAATAQVIRALHRSEGGAGAQIRYLAVAAALALVVVWLRDGHPQIIPAMVAVPGTLGGLAFAALTFGASASPLMVGVGLLLQARLALSVMLGAAVAWGVCVPLAHRHGWIGSLDYPQMAAWLVWPGLGLMLGSSVPLLWTTVRDRLRQTSEGRERMPAAALGTLLGAALLTALALWHLFDVGLLAAAVLIPMALVAAVVCSRAAGQSDLAPYGPLGQVTQAGMGLLAPGHVVANLGAGAVVGGVSVHAANALWTWKAAELLGASRRAQLVAQLLGTLAGALIVVPAYALFERAWGVGTQVLPAPAAAVASAMAKLFSGVGGVSTSAAWAGLIAFGLGLLLSLGEGRSRWCPASTALGVGFLIPAFYSATLAVGGLLSLWAQRTRRADAVQAAASGLISGEAIAGIVIAALLAGGMLGGH